MQGVLSYIMDFKIQVPSGKDKKQYQEQVAHMVEGTDEIFHKKSDLKLYSNDQGDILVYDKQVAFIVLRDTIIPSIHFLRDHTSLLPKIVVDVGAIRFVANGADIMRPGIVQIDERIQADDIVEIVEEKNGATLGIGRARFPAAEMETKDGGKVVDNLHHLKDQWWSLQLT